MPSRTGKHVLELVGRIEAGLRERPVRLCEVRSEAARVMAHAEGVVFKRSIFGEVVAMMNPYCPLPERIELYRQTRAVYQEHVENGELDLSSYKNSRILDLYYLCTWWLEVKNRYPYGDVRLLRPLLGEVLIEAAEWPRSPYPEYSGLLGQWYEDLAPGGALYPSDEHLDYVRRFESFAEQIIWDSRGRDRLTIVNFPAPPNWPPKDLEMPEDEWWWTEHAES
ncbi:MAG: hypothetical protein AAGC55_09705 [Myxococcota bacterium]